MFSNGKNSNRNSNRLEYNYLKIAPVAQLAEATDLKSVQVSVQIRWGVHPEQELREESVEATR